MDWRTIPSLPDYEASETGGIRRAVRAKTRPAGFVLKPTFDGRYVRVKLTTPSGESSPAVHQLVCEAFHGKAPTPKHQVAHGDGNGQNNHFTNLRWATAKENQQDRKLHGTWPSGERNANAVLDWASVRLIQRKFDSGETSARALAAEFGTSNSAMERVCNRKTWKEEAARDALDDCLKKLTPMVARNG